MYDFLILAILLKTRTILSEFLNVPLGFSAAATAAAKSLQSCPTLCDPVDGSPLGSFVPGILQARILERVAISFSNAWKWKVKVKSLSRAWLLATPWTGAHQAPPSMGFFQARVLEWGAIAFVHNINSAFDLAYIWHAFKGQIFRVCLTWIDILQFIDSFIYSFTHLIFN